MYEKSKTESEVMPAMPEETKEETITRSAAAELLGVRESQLRRWEKTTPPRLTVVGTVPAGSLPRVLYRKADVDKLKAERDLYKSSGGARRRVAAIN